MANSSTHSSDRLPAANNRDLALTRKRTGHIDAAVRLLAHFVAAALVVLWSVFQLVMGEVNVIGDRIEDEGVQSMKNEDDSSQMNNTKTQ